MEDLSGLPVPRYEILTQKRTGFMLPVQAGRGCPHRCTFCSIAGMYQGDYMRRDVGEVVRDIRRIKELGYRGFYLVEPTGAGRFDQDEGRFSLPVCGFSVRDGRPRSPVAATRLHGTYRSFLQGIQVVARDLAFQPLAGMIGSPTLLVGGLELRDDA